MQGVVFDHDCFWHRHEGCRLTTTPKTSSDFWKKKFQGNIDRDARHAQKLAEIDWRVAVAWECSLNRSVERTAQIVEKWLHGKETRLVVG